MPYTHKPPLYLYVVSAFLAAAILMLGGTLLPADGEVPAESGKTAPEMWGYLMEGAESAYTGREPITDLCYFRAIINYRGELIGAYPIPKNVPVKTGVRTHLVVAELSSRTLEHFILAPEYKLRKKLLDAITAASASYDGVQIDFESVPDASSAHFLSFLDELKTRIAPKVLSVAVPARREFAADAYNYDALNKCTDRIIVMAYDEHWNGSVPGPIASTEWCEKVVTYASAHISKEKLVMGLPLYGRAWQRPRYSKEVSYAEVQELTRLAGKENDAVTGYPRLEFGSPATVVLYYENSRTIMEKITLYTTYGVSCYAFWRLGQEPSDIWSLLTRYAAAPAKPKGT